MKKIKLKNGLEIFIVPRKSLSFAVIFGLSVGSKNENNSINGISHLLEHLVFKGTKKLKTQDVITFELEKLGLSYNAFTGKDLTAYYIVGGEDKLKESLEILTSLVFEPLLEKKYLEKEKNIILQEIYMYHDDPNSYVSELFEQVVFKGTSYEFDIAGTQKSLKNISHKDLINYHSHFYNPENTTIVFAGNISEKKINSLIKKNLLFIKNKSKAKYSTLLYRKKVKQEIFKFIEKDTKETHIRLGFLGYNFKDKRRYPLIVLSSILGQGMYSYLFREIRERLGLCYYIYSEPVFYKDTGHFSIQAGIDNKKIDLAIKNIIKILKNLKISQKDIKRAKNYIIGNFLVGLEKNFNLAKFYLIQNILGSKKIITPEDFTKFIKDITIYDLKNISQDIIKKSKLKVAGICPSYNKKIITEIIKKIDF